MVATARPKTARRQGSGEVIRRPTKAELDPVRHVRFQRRRNVILAWTTPIVLLLLWELTSRAEWLDPRYFPPPTEVWDAAVRLWRDGSLWEDFWFSWRRVVYGFVLGSAQDTVFCVAILVISDPFS